MNRTKGHEHIEAARSRGVSQGSGRIHALYETYSIICADATGLLYKAEHAIDGRKVAIKVLSEYVSVDKTAPGATLHKHLVTTEAVLTSPNGDTLVVMPRPHGTVLDKILSKQGRLHRSQAVSIAMRILSILKKLHDAGRLHNSINPKTVFLSRTAGGGIDVDILYLGLQGDSAALNDLSYLSPEQASDVDQRHPASDLFAVGIILYEMLLGQHPFSGRTQEETLGRILMEELCTPADFKEENAGLASVIERALQKNPRDRFQDANAMSQALSSVRKGSSQSAFDSLTSLTPIIESERPSSPMSSPRSSRAMPPPVPKRIPPVPVPSSASRPAHGAQAKAEIKGPVSAEIDSEPITVVKEIRCGRILAVDEFSEVPAPSTTLAPIAPQVTLRMVSEDPDLTNPSIKTRELAIEERRYIAHSKRSRKLLGLSAGAFIVAGVASAVLVIPRVWTGDEPPKSGPRADPTAPEAVKGQEATPASDAVVEPAVKSLSGLDEVGSNAKGTLPTVGNNDEVVIEIDGLPSDAIIKIGHRRVNHPIVLPKSDTPEQITIIPRKKRSFTISVVPDENRRVDMASSAAVHATVKPERAKRAEPQDPPTWRGHSGSLSSNPFKLKTNPFPTGE